MLVNYCDIDVSSRTSKHAAVSCLMLVSAIAEPWTCNWESILQLSHRRLQAFCIYTTDPEMQWQIHQVYAMGSISNHYDWFVMQGVITLLVELDYCGFCLSRILLYFPLPKRACLPPSGGVTSQISPMYIVIYAICILWVGFSNWMNISLNWIQPNSIFSISDKKNNFGHFGELFGHF